MIKKLKKWVYCISKQNQQSECLRATKTKLAYSPSGKPLLLFFD
jgi:hypothetical protein